MFRAPLVLLMLLFVLGCSSDTSRWSTEAGQFLSKGQDAKAQEVIEQGIKRSSDKYRSVLTALTLYGANRRTKAREEMLTAVLSDPQKLIGRDLQKHERSSLLFNLADLRYNQGRIQGALEPAASMAFLDSRSTSSGVPLSITSVV